MQDMEVPRLGVELELQLLAYTTATATQDPSPICNLRHSSRQCWILNPLSEGRDRTHIFVDASRVPKMLSHHRNVFIYLLFALKYCSFLFPNNHDRSDWSVL